MDTGTIIFRNTIVAGNTSLTGSPNCKFNAGVVASQGFDLVFPGTGCGFINATDKPNQDPKLGPLQANGSQIPTHALLPGSAAIDAGNTATPGSGGTACPAVDARGLARLADGDLDGTARCDIGAYELASFSVTSTFDADDASPGNFACAISTPGPCTLRAAIREANAIGGATISLPAKHFTLIRTGPDDGTGQTGDLDVTGGIIIKGAGPASTIIQACDADAIPNCPGISRVFVVVGSLSLSGVTVRKGNVDVPGSGGGIENFGTLALTDVVLDGNRAGSSGGGLVTLGPATLFNVSITNNQARTGGGGIDNFGGVLSLTNVTLSGNSAGGPGGGGLYQERLSTGSPSATLTNVTVANNIALGGAAGIEPIDGTITLRNSIVAVNTVSGGSSNCDVFGAFASQGFNLVFPGAGCGFTQATDRTNQDPKLGPLQDNGGSTPTMALLAGSAAIDAGNTATPGTGGTSCTGIDQRGIVRLQDGDLDGTARCDIGAYEARLVDLCVQRPPAQLVATRNGQGGLSVTVTRGLGTLTELDFHNGVSAHVPNTNARVDVAGSSSSGSEIIVHFSTPPVSQQFTVTPLDATKPTTVPLDAFDACGRWSTLVGGGAGAFSQVGTFTLTGLGPTIAAGQTAPAQLGWALPAPRPWRELASLELRLTDGAGVAWGVRWTETGDTFAVTETRTPALFALAGPHA
jgi:CSLREA domain-containing protein